ncbi:MAG: hypothetical protein AAFZ65_13195 [Planctomycetota bacterium]
MSPRSEGAAPAALGLVRAATGALLLYAAWIGLAPPQPTGDELRTLVESALPRLSSPTAWWGQEVLLHQPAVAAALWRWSLLAVGLGLLLGALVRPLGLLGAVLMLHAWIYGRPDLAPHHVFLAFICATFAVARAGRGLGLDQALDNLLPTWMTLAPDRRRRY